MTLPTTLTIRETIHHGDYRNVREQTVSRNWAGFTAMLDESPYNRHSDAADYAENRYTAQLFANLLTTGRGSHGWADYEVVE